MIGLGGVLPTAKPGDVEARIFPKGVHIVTSGCEEGRAGMTAAWVSRVSGTPPLVAVAMHRESATRATIQKAGWFVVHALPEEGLHLAHRFGQGSSRDHDKFAGLDVETSPHGQPILRAALAYLECRLERREDVGDHQLVIGEIVGGAILRAGEPLRYKDALFPE